MRFDLVVIASPEFIVVAVAAACSFHRVPVMLHSTLAQLDLDLSFCDARVVLSCRVCPGVPMSFLLVRVHPP